MMSGRTVEDLPWDARARLERVSATQACDEERTGTAVIVDTHND